MTREIGLLWVWVCTIVDAEASPFIQESAPPLMLYVLSTILNLISASLGDFLALFSIFFTYSSIFSLLK
jgi:hypothetical protein